MRAAAPLALGCVSLVLCVLQLPACRPLPAGRSPKHREPPDRRASPAARLLQPPPAPGALGHALPAPRHGPHLALRHHPRRAARHGPRLALRHRPWRAPRRRPWPRPDPRPVPWLPARRPGAALALRGRRHLRPAPLLRVGCVLGTCQVQNLSHRLWQLVGQSGRQDSSPMNPHSPHSYG